MQVSSAAAERTSTGGSGRRQRAGPAHRALSFVQIACWLAFVAMTLHISRDPAIVGRYSKEYFALLLGVGVVAILTSVMRAPAIAAYLWENRFAITWFVVFCPLLIAPCIEVAMRTFNLLGSNFYDEIRRYTRQLALDDKLYFRNPSSFDAVYQGVEVRTNAMGLRERPIGSKQPGRPRILMLGDSVLFGWGVPVEDTASRQLERLLSVQAGVNAETINSGVPGYNSYQEMTFLQTRGATLKPDGVVLLYVDNDIDPIDPAHPHLGVRPDPWKHPAAAFDYYAGASRFYFMLRHLIPALLKSNSVAVQKARDSFGWRQSMDSITATGRYCKEHNLPFVLVQFRMTPGELGDALRTDLQAIAMREGFVYADSLPWFDGKNIRHLTNSFIDIHPNAQGQRVIAEGVEKLLLSNGVLSASRSAVAAAN
jgi:lysophospholipase L1-like esterase